MPKKNSSKTIPALQFKQWLDVWNEYKYDPKAHRRKPPEFSYLFSMPAAQLRKLCDVYKRERDGANAEGIQRLRDQSRTSRIRRYVRSGYPYGDLKPAQRTPENATLRKPGWLPTAIVVNILVEGDQRRGKSPAPEGLVQVRQEKDKCSLLLPDDKILEDAELAPFEVIDGQHRLWAFDDANSEVAIPDDFELPVVAFHGLDVAWQAYLFWSINVSPKRINPSHAFDLYPLLRTQDWLEQVGELKVYREARAQEITEHVYSHPKSVWQNRINMLGERGGGGVSQAAWVRALLTTLLGTGKGASQAGLFQADLQYDEEPLHWTRPQQVAFLLEIWNDIRAALDEHVNEFWIREYGKDTEKALKSKTSWLNQDQGMRAVLNVANDIFYYQAETWKLNEWFLRETGENETSEEDVDAAIASLQKTPFRRYMKQLADGIVCFDWRSIEGPGVKGDEKVEIQKRSYRGSGGYTAMRIDVLKTVAEEGSEVGQIAGQLVNELANK